MGYRFVQVVSYPSGVCMQMYSLIISQDIVFMGFNFLYLLEFYDSFCKTRDLKW